jgi:hypothetical protein
VLRSLRHAKMYEMGDKYDVGALKELARARFYALRMTVWNEDAFAPARRTCT